MQTNVYKFLWKYISKLKFLYFSVILSIVFGELFLQSSFFYAAKIVDLLADNSDRLVLFRRTVFYALIVTGLLFGKGLLFNVMIFLEARFLPVYMSKISKDLFKYAHRHSTAFFAEEMAGNISSKIRNIIDNSYDIYYQILWGVISPLIAISITFLFIFNVNIELAFIMLGLNILLIFTLWRVSIRMIPYSEKRADAMSASHGVLVDSISNSALVKNFSNYLFEKRHYFKFVKKAALADRMETRAYGFLFVTQGVIRAFLQAVFYTLPLWYWYKEEITVGDYVLIASLINGLSNIYNHMSMTFLQYFKSYGSIKDGLELLARPSEVLDCPNAKPLKISSPDISIEHLYYHYKGNEPLFKDFNLDVPAYQKVGLIGRSGSGKSTLIKLLSRYYDIQSGEIKISGQNIATVTQDSLRRAIALIPQDPSLFNRTIMENIRYGNLQASDQEVYEAAKKAYCHDFITALPQGYDSKVGERGVMLSGGERQRIAIARAILKNAPILILDEATSALDSESENYIQDALRELMKDKTVIAIAHRLSTLKEMDKLVVMENGRIIEQGSHQSLIRRKGSYYNFYQMQTSGFLKIES